MNIRKARAELNKLKEAAAPVPPVKPQTFFVRYDDETNTQALARYGLDAWPEGTIIVECLAGDRKIL